jgi:chaperonin GroES
MIKPVDDKVVIEPLAEGQTIAGGIIIPESAQRREKYAKVIAIGTGGYQNGVLLPTNVVVGDTIIYAALAGMEVSDGDKKYLIIRFSDVLAKIVE